MTCGLDYFNRTKKKIRLWLQILKLWTMRLVHYLSIVYCDYKGAGEGDMAGVYVRQAFIVLMVMREILSHWASVQAE